MTDLTISSQIQRLVYFRDLLRELVVRDMKVRYKRSVLGIIWSLLNPLAQLLVFNFIFQLVLPLGIPNYATFVFIGILSWTWFSSSLLQATKAIVDNPQLVRRPGFPPAVLPIVTVTSHFIHFLLALPILVTFLLLNNIQQGPALLALPLLIALQFLFTLSLAYFVASIHVTFRDTQYLLNICLMLAFYLTPIFYDAGGIPQRYLALYNLNPLVHIVNAYRAILMRAEWPAMWPLLVLVLVTALLLYTGYAVFTHMSTRFAEEL